MSTQTMKQEYAQKLQEIRKKCFELAADPISNDWGLKKELIEGEETLQLYMKFIPEISNKFKVHRVKSLIRTPLAHAVRNIHPDHMKGWIRLLSKHHTLERVSDDTDIRLQIFKSEFRLFSNRSFCTLTSHHEGVSEEGHPHFLFTNVSIEYPDVKKHLERSVLGTMFNYIYLREFKNMEEYQKYQEMSNNDDDTESNQSESESSGSDESESSSGTPSKASSELQTNDEPIVEIDYLIVFDPVVNIPMIPGSMFDWSTVETMDRVLRFKRYCESTWKDSKAGA